MSSPPGPHPPGLDRDALVAAVREGCATVPDGARVVIALSGGPDSTAMAYLVGESRPDLDVTLVHVRHGLRDDREDVRVVERTAAYLGVPLEIREVSVRRGDGGPQAAAREARYVALREVAADVGGAAILVGHTAEDQAETVLLRVARGTGTAGLGAMAPVAGDLVRPLLHLRRLDVRRFVVLEGLPTASDPSNQDLRVPRVAARELGLPLLERLGPDPVGALGRLAALAREDDAALRELADACARVAAVRVGPVVAVRDRDLDGEAVAVARRVWRRLLADVGSPPPSAATVARITELARGQRVQLPGGVVASAGGGWRALAPRRLPRAEGRDLQVPGRTPWPPAGITVVATTPAGDDGPPSPGTDAGQIAFALPGAWTPAVPEVDPTVVPPGGRPDRLHLVAPADVGALELRHRRPGDRVATAVGRRTVADLLVDAGVPRPVRELWPVVAVDDRVVWLPGVAADAEVLAGGRADPGLLLHVTTSSGSGPR